MHVSRVCFDRQGVSIHNHGVEGLNQGGPFVLQAEEIFCGCPLEHNQTSLGQWQESNGWHFRMKHKLAFAFDMSSKT